MTAVHETAEWLDGPQLVEWFREQGVTDPYVELGASGGRRLKSWEKGGAANVYAVDRILTHLGWKLWEIPEEVWRPELRGGTGRRIEPVLEGEIVAALQVSGATHRSIAQRFGVAKETVSRCARDMDEELEVAA